MPHKEEQDITAIPLHDTFAAEVRGVDFSQELSEEAFAKIYEAITKVE
jgi:alpha-ketoglutarate-dependent 2,4-dichlorophenoxyacetate dioxygenase